MPRDSLRATADQHIADAVAIYVGLGVSRAEILARTEQVVRLLEVKGLVSTIGPQLREWRERSGLPINALVALLQERGIAVTAGGIARIEQGRYEPRPALALALGDLIDEAGE